MMEVREVNGSLVEDSRVVGGAVEAELATAEEIDNVLDALEDGSSAMSRL